MDDIVPVGVGPHLLFSYIDQWYVRLILLFFLFYSFCSGFFSFRNTPLFLLTASRLSFFPTLDEISDLKKFFFHT